MYGDFDITVFSALFPVAHVFFLLNSALKYREEHFSASVNKVFSDLCLR